MQVDNPRRLYQFQFYTCHQRLIDCKSRKEMLNKRNSPLCYSSTPTVAVIGMLRPRPSITMKLSPTLVLGGLRVRPVRRCCASRTTTCYRPGPGSQSSPPLNPVRHLPYTAGRTYSPFCRCQHYSIWSTLFASQRHVDVHIYAV
jgi:hypothetical protein